MVVPMAVPMAVPIAVPKAVPMRRWSLAELELGAPGLAGGVPTAYYCYTTAILLLPPRQLQTPALLLLRCRWCAYAGKVAGGGARSMAAGAAA